MKYIYSISQIPGRRLILSGFAAILCLCANRVAGQSCPGNSLSTISTFPNTYYPGTSVNLAAGTKTMTLGPSPYGTTPISSGDVLLIMQMQGAEFILTNSGAYGTGSGTTGAGYIANTNLLAGNMEYVVAASSVPLTGGTLTIQSGLKNSYKDTAFNAAGDGQYTYQIIRVPMYYDLKLTGPITAPSWNGSSGGVLVLYAVDSINFNGQTVSASGQGFRGGSYYALGGASGYLSTDFYSPSYGGTNASKGEGIAGTPRFIYYNGAILDNQVEGYPGGAFARGAPGNAGGGGTDGHPSANDQNTGGGGGGNGGAGGGGGNGWSSASVTGGRGGGGFLQASPSHVVLGGGGGSGTTNNGTGTPGGFASGGASGGGIVIIMANTAFSGTGTVDVSGAAGNSTVANDGSGGGGAGGTAILFAGGGLGMSNITVNAAGGAGGTNSGAGAMHGPGGGGGGGIVYANNTLNAASSSNGGAAGTTFSGSNYGALAGANGTITQNTTQVQLSTFPVTCTLLAVNFISIAAQQQNGQVTVDWTVGNEINVSEYLVEKSVDGRNFTSIGSVAYTSSGSNTNHYEYTDDNGISVTGAIYYRIKEIEWTGGSDYSRIVTISADGQISKLTVYPNPVIQAASVSFVAAAQGKISLRLVDIKGSQVWQTQYQAYAGVNTLQLSAISSLADGLYFLQYSDGQKPQTVKLMVRH